jgi:hypothetical protein
VIFRIPTIIDIPTPANAYPYASPMTK